MTLTIVSLELWWPGLVATSNLPFSAAWLALLAIALCILLYFLLTRRLSKNVRHARSVQLKANGPHPINSQSLIAETASSQRNAFADAETRADNINASDTALQTTRITAALAVLAEMESDKAGDQAGIQKQLDAIKFLLRPEPQNKVLEPVTIVDLIDSVKLSLEPMLKTQNRDVLLSSLVFERFEMDVARAQHLIAERLLRRLGNQPSNDVRVSASFDSNQLSFKFSIANADIPHLSQANKPSRRHDSRLDQNLELPATQLPIAGNNQQTGTALLIISDAELRKDLEIRLQAMGVRITADFNSPNINWCYFDDPSSEIYRSVASSLQAARGGTRPDFIQIRFETSLSSPHDAAVNRPITQQKLRESLEQLSALHAKNHVLVVDDSEPSRKMITMQLRQLGVSAEVATSGEAALISVNQKSYSAIFMDSQMPGLSGEETTRRIRAILPNSKIIGLTAHATHEERQRYRAAGMSAILEKPASIEQLRELLITTDAETSPHATSAIATADTESKGLIVDQALALSLANNKADLAQELMQLLIESLPDDLEVIQSSQTDLPALAARVHKLHGAVRYCGVPQLAAAVQSLEQSIKSGSANVIEANSRKTETEILALIDWYKNNGNNWLSE